MSEMPMVIRLCPLSWSGEFKSKLLRIESMFLRIPLPDSTLLYAFASRFVEIIKDVKGPNSSDSMV